VSGKYLEASEEIEVVLADLREVRRILKEERVAIMCAYQLMHFLADEEPFRFLQAGEEV
jgi:ADP-ribose pyrophosphatase